MKIALITDQHFGARNDSIVMYQHFNNFYENTVFPYLEKENIDTVIDLGDTFDRRKFINFRTLSEAKKMWFDRLRDRGIKLRTIAGNHTTYYKNTNALNTMDLLFREYENISVYDKGPATVDFDGFKILLLPWICADNAEESAKAIQETSASVCFGHLEIQGFMMYRDSIACYDGLSSGVFDKFELVCSGHFHHKSKKGNIQYLGSPYEMTWSDYNDPRGFHIFDTSTKELTFIRNPYKMFHKVVYEDKSKSRDEILERDYSMYANTYVKVIVSNKTKPGIFDQLLDKLYSVNPQSLSITEDHKNLYEQSEDEIFEDTEDTMTVLKNYLENEDYDTDFKNNVTRIIEEFYHKAQQYSAD
jgi:DNA repair exonuclease SbcCD nuclease subunit